MRTALWRVLKTETSLRQPMAMLSLQAQRRTQKVNAGCECRACQRGVARVWFCNHARAPVWTESYVQSWRSKPAALRVKREAEVATDILNCDVFRARLRARTHQA